MRKLFVFLNLIGLLVTLSRVSIDAKDFSDISVEVLQIRDLGISDTDESNSVIEIIWKADEIQKDKIAAFKLLLAVTYADGTKLTQRKIIEKKANSIRVEVPSVKSFGGRSSAFIKKIDAKVSAISSNITTN